MSLGVAFKAAEGIVLAADSRVTIIMQRQGQPFAVPAFYDNATKLLQVDGHDFVAAVTYGAGALGTQAPRTAGSFMPEFETELGADRLPVDDFATRLGEFFKRQWDAAQMPAGADPMVFLVGGYDEGAAYGRVFELDVPHAIAPVEKNPGDEFGITWVVNSRLPHGCSTAMIPTCRDSCSTSWGSTLHAETKSARR